MAILGAQLVLTLITVSIIQKLNPHFSFAKWILCSTGLYRYLHPTDEELRAKAGLMKEKYLKNNGKNHRNGYHGNNSSNGSNNFLQNSQQFHIPRNLDVEIETMPVTARDVVHLRFYGEYQWLLDFSIYAALVYIISEIYHHFIPLKNEVNLSMVWCLLVVFFAIKLLSSLTVLYFQSEESIGERSMVIVAFLVYLLIAMIVLIIDESILETGLENAYTSFNRSASDFLNGQGLASSGPASKIVVKFFIALTCGAMGSLFTFPGLRMAKMHWDSLEFYRANKLKQFLLNLSFILPFLLVVLWIRPISRDYLTVRIFKGMDKPLLEAHVFETLRLLLVILVVILRFALMPIYLQSYLNIAHERVKQLRQEAGRITNIEFQKKISSIFYYLCVVTLQFAAPLILCLYLTLMYKSLGGYSWLGQQNTVVTSAAVLNECAADDYMQGTVTATTTSQPPIIDNIGGSYMGSDDGSLPLDDRDEFNILKSAESLQTSWIGLKSVFTTDVYKGFLGFATWWSYFTLFASTSLGIIYLSYFNNT